ncbi:hypothetical protein GCM10010471_24840 [Leucobacter komagatae]
MAIRRHRPLLRPRKWLGHATAAVAEGLRGPLCRGWELESKLRFVGDLANPAKLYQTGIVVPPA